MNDFETTLEELKKFEINQGIKRMKLKQELRVMIQIMRDHLQDTEDIINELSNM